MAKHGGYSCTVAATPVLATFLAIVVLSNGQTQENLLPEIICTVQPALLPAGLTFSGSSTTDSQMSRSEIRAYVSSPLFSKDNITFTRTFDTGNEFTLPDGSVLERTENGAKIIMPNYKNTTGIYTCELESRLGTFSTSVVLHAADSDPRPARPTVTVNVGDRAILHVHRNNLMGIKWKRTENNRNIPEGKNRDRLTIESATVHNGTTYEAYEMRERMEPHSIIRLIVRECPQGYWGPDADCTRKCPICYNGGVCDDKMGQCICAPGFSGRNCQNLHGRNRFGQQAQYNCSDSDPGSSPGCRGILFCLSDPYGCSCAAGFKGLDCEEECNQGYFGADCLQECHCAENQICAKDTGRCDRCAIGYTGNNCQEKVKLLIDESSAIGYNTGLPVTIRCLSLISSLSSDVSLVLPNGTAVAPRTTRPIISFNNGLTAEFEVILENNSQEFTCVVDTSTAIVNRTALVTAFVPPQLKDPPQATLKPFSTTTIMVSWNPWEEGSDIGDGPVIFYLVQYRKANTSMAFTTFFNGSANSVAIPLERETTYEIVVVAVRPGEGGEGPASPAAFVDTQCTAPTDTPVVIKIERRQNAFTVTWELPARETWGCSQLSTHIHFRGNGVDSVGQVDVPSKGNSLVQNHTVTDLEPCVVYTIQLRLSNSGGDGPFTGRETVHVGGPAPGPVTDVDIDIRATRLKLMWRRPEIGCEILQYNITHQLINFDQCNQTKSETKWRRKSGSKPKIGLGSNTEKEVLLPYSTYNISITATSEDGVGDTHFFQTTTDSTFPGAPPSNITVANAGSESLIFTWEPVLCGLRHGLIDNYTSRLTDEDGGKVVIRSVGSHIRSVPYINLSSCTNYSFEIRANVGDRRGEFSGPLSVATPIGLPETVTVLRAFAPRWDIIHITWDRPNNTRCNLIYHVEYSLSVSDQCLRTVEETIIYADWTASTNYLLEGLAPYSTYTVYVTANSQAGNGTRAAVVATTKQSVPGTIINITAHNVTESSVTYVWEAPPCGKQHGLIRGYHYVLLQNKTSVVQEGSTSNSETEVTFYDLQGCTSYSFQVRAWNDIGNGSFDKSVAIVTGVSVPDPIGSLYVEPQGPHALHISWMPPINTPCPVSNYVVKYSLLNREQCQVMDPGSNLRNISTTEMMYVLNNLEPYSTYNVNVMAETEVGVGNALSIIRNTTTDVPGRILYVNMTNKTNSSLTFNWNPPPCGKKGGPITSYGYLVLTDGDDEITEDIVASNHVTLENLKPCSSYYILVKARNDITNVEGMYSPKANGTTAAAKPGKVENVLMDVGTTSALLKWSPPSNFTCAITSYSIFNGLRNPRMCGKIDIDFEKAGETSETQYVLEGLLPYSVYRVYIVAATTAGLGQSTFEPLITMQGVPEKPNNVRVAENIPGRLSFSWKLLECMESNGIIQGFNYLLLRDGVVIINSNVSEATSTVSFANNVTLPCTKYVFKVRGFTSDGFGDFSPELHLTTVPAVPPAVENPVIYDVDGDPTQLLVVWDLPSATTCEIQDFLVMYGIVSLDNCRDDDDEFLMNTMSIILTNGTDIILDDLHPNTLYNVTITARTAAGEGDNVSIVYRTPDAPPSSPPRVNAEPPLREGMLFFSWEPLPCDEQNGLMTGYNLILEGLDFYSSERVDIDTHYKQYDMLLPCTEYTFRMSGINRAGMGPHSVPVTALTLPVPPNTVEMLKAESIADEPTILNISWTMPTNQICPIHNYTITTSLIRRLQCSSVNELQEDRIVIAGTENNFPQMGLYPASLYNVTISAATEAGMGNLRAYVASTSESAPNASPENIIIRRELQRELIFTWDDLPCQNRNGRILGYQYTLTDDSNSSAVHDDTANKEISIDDLVPYTTYEFRIRARTTSGFGPYSIVVKGKTAEGVPPMPQELDVISKLKTSLHVQWQKPQPPHGIITGYKLAYWSTDNNGQDNVSVIITGPTIGPFPILYNVTDLRPYTRYSIQVQARTKVGYGDWTRPIIIARTDEGTPSAPVDLVVSERSQKRLRVSWKEPDEPNGKIVQYNIKYKAIEKAFDPAFFPGDDITIGLKKQYKILDQLDPATKYEISVSAATSVGSGPSVSIADFTKPPAPRAPTKPTHMQTKSELEVHLQLQPVDGDFSAYHVSVKRTINVSVYRRSVKQSSNFLENSNEYIAAEFTRGNLPGNFTVGDNKTYGGYYNAPLAAGYHYSISLCAVSRTSKDMESSCSEPVQVTATKKHAQSQTPELPLDIIGIVGAIVFAFVVTFIILAVIRKRRVSRSVRVTEEVGMSKLGMHAKIAEKDMEKPKTNGIDRGSPIKRSTGAVRNKPRISTKPTSQNKGWRPPTPISIPNLPKYIKQRKADGDKGFTRDYESMPAGQTYPWDIAKIPENKPKNRYANIIAYDHSRVLLEPYEDVLYSDYINANYVDGHKMPNKYIASQGPNQASTVDFWRMLWQHRVPKVIMLTNIVENGKKKCEKYWPNGVQRYGELLVNMTDEKVHDYYTERVFNMEDDYIGEQRQVKQFHFTAWPDMGLPESPTPLLSFVQKTKEYHVEAMQEGPTVVHCSAGVGRTGTFLAIDATLDMAVQERKINVLDYVYRMRQRRIKMVQTQEQYMFIFEVLLEALLCGDTVFPSNQFSDRYSDLRLLNPLTDKPYIDEQLRALDVLSIMPNEENAKGGRMPENMDKNRYQHLIPIDKYRPYLMTQWKDRTNYINATFLDAYRQKDGFLATQMPLATTVIDFWRMVYDYRSNVIVMLNRLDLEDSSCAQYWPDGGSLEYGPFDVELMSAEECGETIIRTFKLKHTQNRDSRIVHQYQYLGWPERETFPASPSSLLALTELVLRGQRTAGDGPTTVHCMDGVSRSGLFCAILIALGKMVIEGDVDVFHAVKKLRKARAGMVCSLEHYVYCYNTMLTYLESSQVYENYK